MTANHENDANTDTAEDLESLCVRAASGDRQAFRQLVDQTHATAYRLAAAIAPDDTELAELAAEAERLADD